MTPDRPRPEYGEYASPDEQVAAGGYAVEPPVAAASAPTPSLPTPPTSASAATAAAHRSWDSALSIGLLGLASYLVLSSIPGMANLASTLNTVFAQYGYGEFTNISLATSVGLAVNIVQVVLLVIAISLTVASLRRGRLTFWIPLSIGVLANLIVTIMVGVVILNDPAFPAWLATQQ